MSENTPQQKEQARTNIGIISNTDVSTVKFSMQNYTGSGTYDICPSTESIKYSSKVNQLSFRYIPLVIDIFGDDDKRCTFRLKGTEESSCLIPSERNT